MGRGNWYRWDKKSTDNDFLRFSITRLKQEKVIASNMNRNGSWQWSINGEVTSSISYEVNTSDYQGWLRVYYKNKKTDKSYDYKIQLVTTNLNYGGVRWWFICPAQNCGRRVGVLYIAHILACRHCYNIAYTTQNQAGYDRLCDRAFKLARKLGHDGNVFDGFYGKKPKGMHWKTYARKVEEIENLTSRGMASAGARFGW